MCDRSCSDNGVWSCTDTRPFFLSPPFANYQVVINKKDFLIYIISNTATNGSEMRDTKWIITSDGLFSTNIDGTFYFACVATSSGKTVAAVCKKNDPNEKLYVNDYRFFILLVTADDNNRAFDMTNNMDSNAPNLVTVSNSYGLVIDNSRELLTVAGSMKLAVNPNSLEVGLVDVTNALFVSKWSIDKDDNIVYTKVNNLPKTLCAVGPYKNLVLCDVVINTNTLNGVIKFKKISNGNYELTADFGTHIERLAFNETSVWPLQLFMTDQENSGVFFTLGF